MRVSIRGLSFKLTDAIVRHVEDCVEAALGSASGRIDQVTVRLDDVNGPKGGRDKRCRIVLWLRRTGVIVAQAVHEDLYIAVEQAAAKAKDMVRRHRTRRRALHRTYVVRLDRHIRV
ncbi:MAG: HPF/RaiA family ribosome-associated protein [Bacillota bacterium]